MANATENNKRIVKNTLFMYIRMLVQLCVAFYTTRIVFNVLGTDNYGIYSVVGGVIVFFSFLNNGLTSATKRYITTEIAKGTVESGQHVFNVCVIAHIIISAIVLVFAETIGVWAINHLLNIPPDRMEPANWVFQLSIFATVVGIMQSPFDATIVAYERMNIYAYFSILDVVFKLLIVFALSAIHGDKLIIYAWLVFAVGVVMILINRIYCYRQFDICKWKYQKDPALLKDIFKFMSWSLMGQLSLIGTNEGVTMLINVYFNVAVNAAMGVSNQIINNVNKFVSNFQVAFNPQIIKSYANKEYDYLRTLIIRSSKLSSYLVIIFLVPLLFETPNVLSVWLGNYPQYSVEFCLLTFVAIFLEAIGAPLWMLQYAQTNIKQYQIVISGVYGLAFPACWILLAFTSVPPYYVIIVRIIIFIGLLIIRLIYARKLLPILMVKYWLREVLGKSVLIIIISSILTGALYFHLQANRLISILIITFVSLLCNIPLIIFVGFNKQERLFCANIIRKRIRR